jgi:hypothetical protein
MGEVLQVPHQSTRLGMEYLALPPVGRWMLQPSLQTPELHALQDQKSQLGQKGPPPTEAAVWHLLPSTEAQLEEVVLQVQVQEKQQLLVQQVKGVLAMREKWCQRMVMMMMRWWLGRLGWYGGPSVAAERKLQLQVLLLVVLVVLEPQRHPVPGYAAVWAPVAAAADLQVSHRPLLVAVVAVVVDSTNKHG